jgi:hypothetical protein
MKTYTIAERARVIYETVSDVFDYNSNSDVLTPAQLVQKQVNSIPLIAGKVLIPGAGIGSYIPALLEKGVSPSDIYAIEISPAYSRLGSRIFSRFDVNYIHADFLTWRPEMQFDVIIGNPPYSLPKGHKTVSDGTVNLSLKFIEKSVSLLKRGGFISMLTPLNFLKPTDKEKPTRSFNVMEGLSLLSVDTGLEEKWFPGVKTKISLWSATKNTSSGNFTLNGVEWSLDKIPFILDLGPKELKVFKKIWDGMLSGGNPVCCKRVKDGDLYADPGWSLTERVNRRTGKQFIIPWSEKAIREKYEQIHISLDPDEANVIFSKPHIRFFVKAVLIEPTVYHNLFNGLDLGDQTFSKEEQKTIDSYLGDLV